MSWSPDRDHPRGCGEHPPIYTATWSASGSSPRMRGARDVGHFPLVVFGIIPADAGSTVRREEAGEAHQDHPRGCGEHLGGAARAGHAAGSSPRMRGALGVGYIVDLLCRIIPADAGSTSPITGTARSSRDHPRGCGEHGHPGFIHDFGAGSSPRMRGARRG